LDLVGGQLPRRKVGTCGPRYDCYLIRFRKVKTFARDFGCWPQKRFVTPIVGTLQQETLTQ